MPELPEVESTARFLNERIAGDHVVEVSILWPRTVGDSRHFVKTLTDSQIAEVFRRAKFVCFRCVDKRGKDFTVAAHMRMSGSFDVIRKNYSAEKHDRFLLRLSSGKTVSFCDPRKFGRATIVSNFDEFSAQLGIEPLSEQFTVDELHSRLQRKRSLKPLLLDQSVIAGLGNIYVDEVLWHSKLHPLKAANTVKRDDAVKLHNAIQRVLREAIEKQGTDFGDGVVEMGSYTPVAYGRTGKPCSRCRVAIKRIIVGQRSSHYCPACQKRSKR